MAFSLLHRRNLPILLLPLLCGCAQFLSAVMVSAPNRLNPFASNAKLSPPARQALGIDQQLRVKVGPPDADLSVSIADAPDPVSRGANITYSIQLTNGGPDPAANASLSISTPPNTTFVSFSAPGGWTVMAPSPGGTGTVTATNPSVAVGMQSFSLVVQVNPAVPGGTVITGTVTVSSTTSARAAIRRSR